MTTTAFYHRDFYGRVGMCLSLSHEHIICHNHIYPSSFYIEDLPVPQELFVHTHDLSIIVGNEMALG